MWWFNTMTQTSSRIRLQGRSQPSRLTLMLPLIFAVPYVLLTALLMAALVSCDQRESSGHFELDLQSPMFGDIVIEQGGRQTASVVINRNMGGAKFPAAIELSLQNAPEWLEYHFESNPVASDRNILNISVPAYALPGTYRLQLHGASRLDNTLVSDSFTFHIRVTQTGENNHSAQEAALARNTNRLFAGWFN